jgi:hypothetical protein
VAGTNRQRSIVVLFATLITALAVLLAAALAGSPAPGEAAQSTTFLPTADAYVRSDTPDTNYGTSSRLRADGSPTAVSYLRFDLTGSGPVTNATLKLYSLTDSTTNGISVNKVDSNDWSEDGITYSKAPAVGDAVDTSGPLENGVWVSLDVTSAVKGDGVVTLALTTTSSTSRYVASSESTTRPQLIVGLDSTPGPDPTPPPSGGSQPAFPIRAAFYYPWFPEAWSQQGLNPFTLFTPSLGFYRSGDAAVIQKHISSFEYAGIHAGISSWWGQGSKEDLRFPLLLNETNTLQSPLRWAPYYEEESLGDPSPAKIANDLAYIKSRYASDPAYLRAQGKPVIFVFAGGDSCGMADRWKTANASQDFYVVLKVFSGYRNCASQPDSWHQYGPAKAVDQQSGYSYSISPGFHKATELTARLARDPARFEQDVQSMVASGEPWQLVTTFNEWGEGTAVEGAAQWDSASGYGQYLDALHRNGGSGGSPPPPDPTPPPPDPTPPPPDPTPPPPSGSDAVIDAAGDISCPQGADGSSSCRDKATSDLIVASPPDRVLTLGDNQYDSGTLSAYQSYYDPTWGRFKDRTSPTPGNHDPFSSGYSAYFGSSAPSRHYAFDLGSWRLYSLDSNNPDAEEVLWLTTDLAAHPRQCVLAYWHHPRFSSGTTHGDDSSVRLLWQTLYDAGADVVLNGHEHNYERFAPQDPGGTADSTRGLREFVVGTGGRGLYPIGTPEPNSQVRNASSHGVLELTLRTGSYDWKFKPAAGDNFVDTGSDGCH